MRKKIAIMSVVVGLVGASIAVISFQNVQRAGAEARANDALERLHVIKNIALQAEIISGQPLHKVTNSSCSSCPCRDKSLLSNVAVNTICRYNWNSAIISMWRSIGKEEFPHDWLMRDPWNSPFLLNENVTGERCYEIELCSAGPDGIYQTDDDICIKFKASGCD